MAAALAASARQKVQTLPVLSNATSAAGGARHTRVPAAMAPPATRPSPFPARVSIATQGGKGEGNELAIGGT